MLDDHLRAAGQTFVVILFHNCLVFSGVLFFHLVNSTSLFIFRNPIQNVDGLLLALEQDSNGPPLFRSRLCSSCSLKTPDGNDLGLGR